MHHVTNLMGENHISPKIVMLTIFYHNKNLSD